MINNTSTGIRLEAIGQCERKQAEIMSEEAKEVYAFAEFHAAIMALKISFQRLPKSHDGGVSMRYLMGPIVSPNFIFFNFS